MYIHPAGYNFSVFNNDFLQIPSAIYPDFGYDQVFDENYGFRYATFAYGVEPSAPTAYQYISVILENRSAIGPIGGTRDSNNYFPDAPVPASYIAFMKGRLHVKLLGVHNPSTQASFETGWINGFKEYDPYSFDDGGYDVGGLVQVKELGENVLYKIQINRRFYTSFIVLVRVGISQDGSVYGGEPLTFRGVQINLSDS